MKRTALFLATCSIVFATSLASASSHREAPLITETPKVDGTDLYMFRSYETGKSDKVILLANYYPLQDPPGGPNFFFLDPDAIYSIHVDNNGDAKPDITFEFDITNTFRNLTINVSQDRIDYEVPVLNLGQFGTTPTANDAVKNLIETYTLTQVRGGVRSTAANLTTGGSFRKPFDYIGTKSIPNYGAYADSHRYRVGLSGCAGEARVFVGQRKEGFAVAVGPIFDLFNLNPLGSPTAERNDLAEKNVTTFALEVPIACLTAGSNPIIGAWTTASTKTKTSNGALRQVSRLANPLVNEVFIAVKDKDKFNASMPADDAQFAKYVTHPTLPEIIELLFPDAKHPLRFPRTDLVAVFLTGIEGLNKPANVVPSEMMRLNTSIAPKPAGSQNNLGVIAGDNAGFPNGRRPGDDVVDIELRVAMGVLLPAAEAPSKTFPFTDGATVNSSQFLNRFPFLNNPLPGAQ